ncbi:MAG: response regulator [Acidobacteria bacterium]|nr:response regulator [Acidobacteriota bacterium]
MSLKEEDIVKTINPFTCLIVDDSEFARIHLMELMIDIIGSEKVQFQMASGGQEAIELYQRIRPSLVMMDIVMPGIDGVETVDRICQIDPDAKIIMVSSLSYREKVRQAILAGAKHFVVKPIKANLLYRVIIDILTK